MGILTSVRAALRGNASDAVDQRWARLRYVVGAIAVRVTRRTPGVIYNLAHPVRFVRTRHQRNPRWNP